MLNITYISHAILNIFKKSSKASINKAPKAYRGCIVFDPDKCINCKKCVEVCTPKSITDFIENTPAGKRVTYKFDMKTCVFCGLCSDFCPKNAISFNSESKILSTDKNMFKAEGTFIIEDYKSNRNEVLSVTQPITVTQIEELLTTIHGEIDVVYEENKKSEEKEARGELIKILFNENEEKIIEEKPIEVFELNYDGIINEINVEDIKIIPVEDVYSDVLIVKESDEIHQLDIDKLDDEKEENKGLATESQNEELIKELFSNEQESKKTIKDSIFETTANLKDILKNILVKKDDIEVSVNKEEIKEVKEDIITEKEDPIKNEEIENSQLQIKKEEILNADEDKNSTIDLMNTTIRSRELLQKLFPEKNFEEDSSKTESSVQVIYKREDFTNGKVTHNVIKKDLLPKLFPENYDEKESEKKQVAVKELEVSIPEYTHKVAKATDKPKDKKSSKKNKDKKKK